MRLLRFATLTFQTGSHTWSSWSFKFGSVEVKALGSRVQERSVLVVIAAEVGLQWKPKVTRDGLIVVPDRERKQAEIAIETAANLISIAERCKRTISSPLPSVAFLHDDVTEKEWLEAKAGMLVKPSYSILSVNQKFGAILLNDLTDRLDGVALMSEALSHAHPTGQFHEYLRLFERAFRRSSKNLVDPLADFLLGTDFDYARSEINHWIVALRHPATHADVQPSFILEAQVRPVIRRMEQAAYDVLFNKSEWRSPSPQRRNTWVPEGGTKAEHELFVVQGKTPVLEVQALDAFGAYPVDLRGVVVPVPYGAWTGNGSQGSSSQ